MGQTVSSFILSDESHKNKSWVDSEGLHLPFELGKQIIQPMHLDNLHTDEYWAFKVYTTNPNKFCVKPNMGVILPRSSSKVIVIVQAHNDAPPNMQGGDKIIFQYIVARDGATEKHITPEMFEKESGNEVIETETTVIYGVFPIPPSSVQEGYDEESSPQASLSSDEVVF